MQFTQGLHRAVQLHPDKTAIICEDRRYTFRELKDRVSRLAKGFHASELSPNSAIALLSLNSDFYLHYYLACAWGGFVVNPVNFRWSIGEIIYSINDSQSRGIILDDNFVHFADQLREGCPSLQHIFYCGQQPDNHPALINTEGLITQHDPMTDVGATGDDLFGIFYTGGTTGFPKGVLLSHTNICSSGLGFLSEGAFPDGCLGLHAAPMFHLADMSQVICLLLRGGTHVMLPAFTPQACLEVISNHKITDLLLVPTMLQMMVDYPTLADFDLSSIRRVYYGGSPFTEAGIDKTLKILPGVELMQVYGMTESSATITFLPWREHQPENRHKGHLRSAGRAFPHTQIRVVDGQDNDVATGCTGEIIFRSPGMMQGYQHKPEETANALRNGWMHTGDLGYLDHEGFLFVVDRLKDMIISGGENVYCTEVENAIGSHPDVATCAVFGVPDAQWGERVHASLVMRPGKTITQDELLSHCKSQIAGYKCPRTFSLHEALPLTGAGKVKKNELRDLLTS